MKIVADENIPLVTEVFGCLGKVQTYAGRSITAAQVKGADALLVRSVTSVNESLLRGSNVKFVGTCTIGTDHIDQAYLQAQGIGFSSSPGCNAYGVVDYVISALVRLSMQQDFDLSTRCVGVVGVGNVGSRLKARLEAMGIRCLCCDPLHDDQNIPGLVHLDELIAESDIISLHTPLTKNGGHPTFHLFNAENLPKLKPGSIFINTSRGAVVDNRALTTLLSQRKDITAVMDVWEGEPDISLPLLDHVALATPHIAGYSLDGKINGTRMVYQALCRYFGFEETVDVDGLAPAIEKLEAECDESASILEQAYQLVLACYDVRRDDLSFRAAMVLDNNNRPASFDALRKNYPERRELGVTGVKTDGGNEELNALLKALGFKV